MSTPSATPSAPASPTPTPSAPLLAPASPTTPAIVVTNAPYGAIALWRVHANGAIESVPFPWSKLSNIDSLVASSDGREVAYVEGGWLYGPLVVRAITDGAKTTVAPHRPGHELKVVAFSVNGRKILFAERTAKRIPRCSPGHSDCIERGPAAYRVYDRDVAKTTRVELILGDSEEIAALLDSGELLVTNLDGAFERFDPLTKTRTPIAGGRYVRSHHFVARDRVLSTGWDETTKRTTILALDLATWNESAITTPGGYAEALWPAASPSGRRVAWTRPSPGMKLALVVDGTTRTPASRDLVGFQWIDDTAIVAHYRNRLDVVATDDGAVRGTFTTNAEDTAP
ncbi:MAG: hypothetical protein HOO96_02575 [Polyangiaceae bacterium]|nr:hypothetical protein [Polyangiaceae bacterium]